MVAVIDTSAMLALIRSEPGASVVVPLLTDAVMSTVNWSELAQKLFQRGADGTWTARRLQTLGVRIEPFTTDDALTAAQVWQAPRSAGLSLADRACLALAGRLGVEALTADRAWAQVDIAVTVRLIR